MKMLKLNEEELYEVSVLISRYNRGKMDASELKDNVVLIMRGLEELLELRTN